MKRNILCLIFLAFTINLFAQVSIDPNPVEEFEEVAGGDWKGHSHIKNESDETKTFKWEKEVECNAAGFDIAICDSTNCYSPSVNEMEFTLAPGEVELMDVHVYVTGQMNGAIVKVTVTEIGNESNTTSGMYLFNTCEALNVTADLEKEQLSIYPNPATEFFRLTDNSIVDKIIIYNIVGQPVKAFNQVFNGQRYDISDLASGLYLISFLDADSNVIKTNRLSTRHP